MALNDSCPAWSNVMTYSIPYLYFDGEIIDDSIPRAELNAKSRLMILLESILSKPQ